MLPRLRSTTTRLTRSFTLSSARRTLHTTRTMSSSTTNTGSGGKDGQQHQQQPPAAAGSKRVEALPAPGEGTSSHPVLDVSSGGGTISLDAMGPIVVNRDGTIARVQNWSKMTEIEKENTLRVLGKRNQHRLAALREAEKAQGDGSGDKEQ